MGMSVTCCAGEGGATSTERQQGTAATGKMGLKIAMPEHIWAQQMIGGPFPGDKFLQFTPTGVAALVASKGAKEVYMNMKVDINMDCGGEEQAGWSYGEVFKAVERYKEDFAVRGIRLTFCLTTYWEWANPVDTSSSYRDITYRAWLEFADMTKLPKTRAVSKDAYNPNIDYSKGTDRIGS